MTLASAIRALTREIIKQAPPEINVKRHGAKANGSADDYKPIQEAIDLALHMGGATIRLPAGRYEVSQSPVITHGKGINLIGDGPDNTIIRAGDFPAMRTVGYWRSIVEGIQFSCDGNTTGGAFELDGDPGSVAPELRMGVQGVSFRSSMFMGNYNSKYTFTNMLRAGGYGQGSENGWDYCSFVGSGRNEGDALFLNNGTNAVQNTLFRCNLQSFLTGVLITAGNVDILHSGFQSTYGYEQIEKGGWDVDCSASSVGDTLTMTGCRTESLRIYKGGGNRAHISNFGQLTTPRLWGSTIWPLNALCRGFTAAGNLKLYLVTTGGTSGASEPAWPESGTVSDGSAVWTQLDYNVLENVAGVIRGGNIAFGQFGMHGTNQAHLEDIFVTRDDCFSAGSFISDRRAPSFRNLRLGGPVPPQNTTRPIITGNNAKPGARNPDPNARNLGHDTLVWTEGDGGGTLYDITLGRGASSAASPVLNALALGGGGFSPCPVTFADIAYADYLIGVGYPAPPTGTMFSVIDGMPDSNPLIGGGPGCLAVRQNGAWKAIS